jgi:tyrosyl-tRNA synthetase
MVQRGRARASRIASRHQLHRVQLRILQAYDFLHPAQQGCTCSCRSDQYGNVVAGIDLIHRTLGGHAEAYGVTAPLVTRSDGRS